VTALRSKALGDVVHRRQVKPRSVLLIASLGVFMAFVDATIVTIAVPDIARSFPDAGIDGLSWVLNAYNIVFAAFLVAAGRAADLLGRKRMSELGLLVFTGASIACALAPSVELLVAARIVQAIGAAIVVPASLALVMHAFPAGERTHAVALWAANAALAAGLGPSAGGVLVDVAGWRAAFLVNIPIGVVAIILARRTLVESRAPGKRTLPDLGGALLLAAAVAALVLAVVKGPDWGWDDQRVIGAGIVAAALAAVFVRRSARHPAPLLDGSLLRIRSLGVANGLMVLAAAAYFGVILNNVLFLTTVWGWSVLEAGLAMTPGPIVAAIVAGPVGRLVERIDARLLISAGGAVWAAGIAGYLLLAGAEPDFLGGWLPATIVAGIGAGISFPTISGVAVAAAPGERFATATAITGVARQIGAAIGVALLIAVIGTPATALGDFERGWALAAGIFVCLAICAPALGELKRDEAGDAEAGPAPPDPGRYRDAAGIAGGSRAARRERRSLPGIDGDGSIARFLSAVPMLAGAPPDAVERLAESASVVRVRGGDAVFYEGDRGDCLFVVAAGRLEAVAGGAEELVSVLHPGDVLGELAVLTSEPRAATVRARRDTTLVRLGGDDFRALLAATPELALAVTGVLARQVRDSRPAAPRDDSPAVTVAVVPLTAETAALAPRFAHDLTAALAGHGRATSITGASALDGGAPLEILDAHERDHDHVVVLAEMPSRRDAWTELCLRQADRVLALTSGGAVPSWVFWHPQLRSCDLVFVDRGDGLGVREWTRALVPRRRFRVEDGPGWRAGVEAAARRLTGRSTGVVLSGGGARGFAHIGVLEELLAAGVEIDRIGGVSCGAWIGAMFALGMDPDEIDARCYEDWVRRNPLTDYTFPRTAMIRGGRVRAVFERNLPGLIEELPRDYFCVSCDLVSGELIVHRDGPLVVAAGASQCLPGLAPPVALDGRLLVDGGVMNNLPVDVMAATGEGPVIAVDVTTRYRPPTSDGKRRRARAGANGVWDDHAPLPSVLETISRSLVLGSVDTEQAAREHADIVIQPVEPDVGMLEWHQLDRVRERGRRAAREVLASTDAAL
jgi:EmrB/QacA subfamily drug resistance transporter